MFYQCEKIITDCVRGAVTASLIKVFIFLAVINSSSAGPTIKYDNSNKKTGECSADADYLTAQSSAATGFNY